MRNFLTRSHYGLLAAGFLNSPSNPSSPSDSVFLPNEGWATPFDGGGNSDGGDLVAVVFDGGQDVGGVALAISSERAWCQRPEVTRWFQMEPCASIDLPNYGEELAEALLLARFNGHEMPAGWRYAKEDEMAPEHHRVLKKIATIGFGLFGQGGHFFDEE